MRPPSIDRVVFVCTSCWHWQLDIGPWAIRSMGQDVIQAVARAHMAHLDGSVPYSGEGECPNPGGRIKVSGVWTTPPPMSDGTPARGTLACVPLPRWWVAR